MISIHAPSRERLNFLGDGIDKLIFQSTLPYRSDSERNFRIVYTAISIHAPLRERLYLQPFFLGRCAISIHAPLRERQGHRTICLNVHDISIHAPLRERLYRTYAACALQRFQSTLPYGSDCVVFKSFVLILFISIHAPLRERPRTVALLLRNQHFNPRSLTGATYFQLVQK